MTIQILFYDFLGPIKLEEWGPPMEKVVYILLSREKDTFNIIYVDECEKSDDASFFTKNSRFKCWVTKAGSEQFLYLAILPLFESDSLERKRIVDRIISKYQPVCNMEDSS